jgi:3-oxoacyl-[acyl-carrier protein] reductase
MDMGLKGKVALAAAASKGLGKAAALALAREGVNLAICARSEATLAATASEIRQATGVDVLAVPADVSRAADITSWVDKAAARFGRIDILVTNAGGPPSGTFDMFSDEHWQAAFNLTFLSVVRMIRAVIPHMRQAGGGRIVNITSVSVKQPMEGLLLSNSIRPAIIGLAKTLSFELAKDKILINNVCPGNHATDRAKELDAARAAREGRAVSDVARDAVASIPLGRRGEPAELAALIVFLCSSQSAFMTGATIQVDGGAYRGIM